MNAYAKTGAVDIGFIVAVPIPGYLLLIPAGFGSLLWLIASTLGIVKKKDT